MHLRAVTFDNITMANTGTGIRMKTERGRGGVVSDIIYRNMCAHRIVLSCKLWLRVFCATECGGVLHLNVLVCWVRSDMKSIEGQCVQITLNCAPSYPPPSPPPSPPPIPAEL